MPTHLAHQTRRPAALAALPVVVAAALAVLAPPASASNHRLADLNVGGAQLFLGYDALGGKPAKFGNLRLTVKFETFDPAVDAVTLKGAAGVSYRTAPTISMRDVSGDGNVDAIVTVRPLESATRRQITTIAASRSQTWWSAPYTVDWGVAGYRLEKISKAHGYRFFTADSRFAKLFYSYGDPQLPLLIKRADRRHLIDVTPTFKTRLRADAAVQRQVFDTAPDGAPGSNASTRHAKGRTALAALVADLARLGDTAGAQAAVKTASDRGDVTAADRAKLGAALKSWGYTDDPSTLGL